MKFDSEESRFRSRKVVQLSSARGRKNKQVKNVKQKKAVLSDAKRMRDIRSQIMQLSDPLVRKKLLVCWNKQALIVGLSGFLKE